LAAFLELEMNINVTVMKKIILCYLFCQIIFTTISAQTIWKNVSTKGMGYVDGLFIHPTTNTKFVRTDVGGMFRFNNETQQWTNIFDGITKVGNSGINNVEAFAVDKNTSGTNQIIYALSGGGNKSYLCKSINNGVSWSINIGWDASIIASGNAEWRCSGEKLAIDPNNNNVVYCGTRKNGLYNTLNGGTQWNKVNAFPKKGGAGGFSAANTGGISFVVFDASSTTSLGGQNVSKNIYVGLIDDGIYRSNDGGASWNYLDNGFDTTTFNPVRAVFNNNRLLVATMKDGRGYAGEIWQFTPNDNNANGVWANKTPGLQNNYGCPFYSRYPFNAIAVKPSSPNTVYVAIRGTMPRKIFYTNNFDAATPTWKILTTESSTGYQGSCATQFQQSVFSYPDSWVNTNGYDWVGDIGFDAVNNNSLWMTSGNGVLTIQDINANPAVISSVNVMKQLEILCVNTMASPPAPNAVPLITASMDVFGIRYTELDNGGAVKLDNTLDLSACISMDYSFKNPNTIVALGQTYEDPPATSYLLKSTNGGVNWQSIYNTSPTCTNTPWGGNIAISSTDPNNIIWVPNYKTFRLGCNLQTSTNNPRFTKDGGITWNNCNNINFSNGSFPMSLNGQYSIGKSLESDKVNGNKFYYYAITNTTNYPTTLWRTVDGGNNWSQMSLNALPVTGGGQLKANPFVEDDIWFAPFNQFIQNSDPNPTSRSLSHSTDGGATFTKLTTVDEVYAFGFGMQDPTTLQATLIVYGKINGIESIFTSSNLGASFTDIGTQNIPTGLIKNIEGDMKLQGRIYAATGCRGIWYSDVPIGGPLPIQLLQFTGKRKENINSLSWNVGSQNNLTKLILEYSVDGINFAPLTEITGAIGSNYNHTTNNKLTYYRLKIVKNNAVNSLYSNVIKLQSQVATSPSLVYPNPTSGLVTLHVYDANLMGTSAKLFSVSGVLLSQKQITTDFTNVEMDQLPSGVYNLKLANGENLKIIKK
jgi:xyloglucan-specific exo-beta-1,4-glucanase